MAHDKYVRLRGRAHVGLAPDGKLTLTMCNAKGNPLGGTFVFSNKPGEKAPPGADYPTPNDPDGNPVNPPIMFLNSEILVRLSQNDFNHYQSLWQAADMNTNWNDAEVPTTITMPDMNPTGPPPKP